MLPYPPTAKRDAAERSLMRVVGGVLALLSTVLALLGSIFHQNVADLILAVIVGLFALRVLLLWLGDTPQHQQLLPTSMEKYTVQAPLSIQGQLTPPLQSRALIQLRAEQGMSQSVPPRLPRSVRPQRQSEAPAFPAPPAPPSQQGVQPFPPAQFWQPQMQVSVPMPPAAQAPQPAGQGNWQYDDEEI